VKQATSWQLQLKNNMNVQFPAGITRKQLEMVMKRADSCDKMDNKLPK
jgi:hypothetical protein